MLARRKMCSVPGRRVAFMTLLLLLLLSVNSLLISLWCARTAPARSTQDTNITKIKFRVNKFKKPKFSYAPSEFHKMDEMLNLPVKNERKPETVSCDNYLGRPAKTQLSSRDHWRFIDEGKHNETYVYSAYYDPRLEPPSVKIFAMSSGVTLDVDPISGLKYCYVWFKGKTRPDVMVAGYEVIPETHGRIYAASIYHCVLSRKDEPKAVALSMHKCKKQHQFLKVKNNYRSDPTRNFTVCVTPFSFEYNNFAQLVEMVEINKLFGASHFSFYNYSTGPQVTKILESYVSEGLGEVLEWDVPVNVDTSPLDPTVEVEIHYFAQLASLNDCLYRNMFESKFIVFSDLDEIIVPQMHETWYDMIRHASAEAEADLVFARDAAVTKPFPSSYLIRNIFFPLQWSGNNPESTGEDTSVKVPGSFNQDEVDKSIRYKINSVLATKCESDSYTWYIRSKYIVWSKVVETVAVHQVNTFLSTHANLQVQVKEHVGLLYHYRNWDSKQLENSSRSCTRLHHFFPSFYQNVVKRLDSLNVNS